MRGSGRDAASVGGLADFQCDLRILDLARDPDQVADTQLRGVRIVTAIGRGGVPQLLQLAERQVALQPLADTGRTLAVQAVTLQPGGDPRRRRRAGHHHKGEADACANLCGGLGHPVSPVRPAAKMRPIRPHKPMIG